MKEILEVKNLTKEFRRSKHEGFVAVDDVSFALHEGECLGLVGESGSGKSTTVRMITRLLDATKGSVFLDGQDVTHVKGKELRTVYQKLQMVFQSPAGSFDARRTLGDSIGESLRNSGMTAAETKERVKKLLRRCELPEDFAKRYPHEVSGGQCQRAAIARAIAISPKLLVCDEATSALDVTVQKQIIELLRDLQKETNMAYLFICHDLALVQQFCDRVLVMHKGEIVEQGTPDEVIWHPKDIYTKNLIHAVL